MSMRILRRHILSSVLKVGIVTALLASLMLMGVDLFTNIYTYMNNNTGFGYAVYVTLFYFPEAFLLALGPSFLFSVTYFLSMLHASNEIMCILNSGISFRRIVRPCIVLAVLLALFYFVFNETVAINCSNRKQVLTDQVSNIANSRNNSDIALSDMQEMYMVHASRYSESTQTLYEVTLIESDRSGNLLRRTNAYKAVYSQDTGLWTFHDVYVYSSDSSNPDAVAIEYFDSMENEVMTLEPQLFRNLSSEISTMSLDLAKAYLDRMKTLNPEEYASLGTQYYKRLFSCLTPLVMMIIACSMNYRFKKNVLFFSIICSLCLAVVYFVVQMMTLMLADQGVIAPVLGVLLPFAAIILVSILFSAIMGRQ